MYALHGGGDLSASLQSAAGLDSSNGEGGFTPMVYSLKKRKI